MACKTVYLFTFLGIIGSALALRCYKCNSARTGICKYDIFQSSFESMDCNRYLGGTVWTKWIAKNFKCFTLVAKGKNGEQFVARGCMPFGKVCKRAAKVIDGINAFIKESKIEDLDCTTCDGDNCNASQTPVIHAAIFGSIAFLLVLLALCWYYRYYWKGKPKIVRTWIR